MSRGEIIAQVLTLVIALYAAAFTTILAVRQRRKRVTIYCNVVPLTTAQGTQDAVEIVAVNVGHRNLEIGELGFRDEYDTVLSKEFDPPSKLEPDMSIRHHFPYEEVLKKS